MGHVVGNDGPGSWHALDELVAEVVDVRERIAALQAAETRLLARAVDLVVARAEERQAMRRVADNDLPLREVSAELAAAMRLGDRTVQARMGDASALVTRFEATLAAWESGRIDAGHAGAILDAGTPIADDATRARFERLALAAAETESPARLRAAARAIAARIDPAAAAERIARAHADRRVRVLGLGDGMGRLLVDVPAALAYAIEDRLTRMARSVRDAAEVPAADGTSDDGTGDDASHGVGDDETDDGVAASGAGATTGRPSATESPRAARTGVVTGPSPARAPATTPDVASPRDTRTIDQLRADILTDLLLAGSPAAHGDGDALGAIAGSVQVAIPVLTLAGDGGEPAMLAGYGPIDPGTARRLAATAPGWDRILTDAHTGAPLAVDRYRPSAELRRFLRIRDEHCRFPGCRQPAHRCDIDHTVDAAHRGPTSEGNLGHFCRRHHTLKHATAWTVRQLGGGVLEWTSSTGRAYRDRPAPTVRFVPNDRLTTAVSGGDPPPF